MEPWSRLAPARTHGPVPLRQRQAFQEVLHAAVMPAGLPFGSLGPRHDHLSEGNVTAQHHVTSFLPTNEEPGTLERPDALPSGDRRKLAHTATTSVSKRSSGTGRWSSSSAAT